MAIDLDLLASLVRLSARGSALLLCAALLAYPRERLATRFVAALVAMHTIHFGFVVLYAQATGGRNIAERGGFIHAVPVALVFYAATLHVLFRGSRRSRDAGLPWRGTETAALLLIALFFASAYSERVFRDVLFIPIAGLLAWSMASFVRWRWSVRPAPGAPGAHDARAAAAGSPRSG